MVERARVEKGTTREKQQRGADDVEASENREDGGLEILAGAVVSAVVALMQDAPRLRRERNESYAIRPGNGVRVRFKFIKVIFAFDFEFSNTQAAH